MDSTDLQEIFLQSSKIKIEDQTIHEGRQEVLLVMLEDQMKQDWVLQNGRMYPFIPLHHLLLLRHERLGYKKLMNLLLQLRKVCDQ